MRLSSLLYPVVAVCLFALGGCATLSGNDPLQVTVAGVEPLPGEGFELRLLVKLRVQNPNDVPIDFTGVYVKLDVQGSTFASGVSDEPGSVPRFGETVVAVPVTVSVLRMVKQVIGVLDGEPVQEIRYEMSGKLHGGAFSTARFESEGTFELPKAAPEVLDPDAGT
jgi:LEA14-like dessication related protein